MFNKVCVLIANLEGGVLKCPPQASEVFCLGGAKAPSSFDRGLNPKRRAQEGD